MALSNWDTLATDLTGSPMIGIFTSPGGFSVEIYKNWVYVSHPAFKSKEHPWSVVATIHEGTLQLQDNMELRVHRGSTKGSVFVAVHHAEYQEQEQEQDQEYRPPIITGMVGIGCYGYSGDQWVGVEPVEIDELRAWIASLEFEFGNPCMSEDAIARVGGGLRYNQGDAYFAEHLEDPTMLQATAPGESHEPVLESLLGTHSKGG